MRRTQVAVKNIPVWINPDPTGIDVIITDLQASLATLTWLDKSFGRVQEMREESEEEGEQIFPAVFTASGKDSVNILALDNHTAYSFMSPNDPEVMQEIFIDQGQNKYSRNINLIFWINQAKAYPAKVGGYVEFLKSEIKAKLRTVRFTSNYSSVEIVEVYDKPEEVFAEYTLSPIKTQNLYYPYQGIRFVLECHYLDNC